MKKILGQGKFVTLFDDDSWEYVKRNNCTGIVVIVAMNDKREVILVEQRRVPVNANVIELPAGLVNDLNLAVEETMEEAAKREMLEETGYEIGRLELLFKAPANAALATEIVSFFRAYDLKKKTAGGGDETEDITVHEVPLEHAAQWLKKKESEGKLIDSKVYAGLYFLETRNK